MLISVCTAQSMLWGPCWCCLEVHAAIRRYILCLNTLNQSVGINGISDLCLTWCDVRKKTSQIFTCLTQNAISRLEELRLSWFLARNEAETKLHSLASSRGDSFYRVRLVFFAFSERIYLNHQWPILLTNHRVCKGGGGKFIRRAHQVPWVSCFSVSIWLIVSPRDSKQLGLVMECISIPWEGLDYCYY